MPEPDVRAVSAVSAEDVLADGQDVTTFDGTEVRKGSVAAFVANAKILETLEPTDPRHPVVKAQLCALVSAVRAAGVFDVLRPRTAALAALVDEN